MRGTPPATLAHRPLRTWFAALAIATHREDHLTAIDEANPPVADRCAVRVAREVLQQSGLRMGVCHLSQPSPSLPSTPQAITTYR